MRQCNITPTKIVFQRFSLQRGFRRPVGILYNVGGAHNRSRVAYFIVAQGIVAPLYISKALKTTFGNLYIFLSQPGLSPIPFLAKSQLSPELQRSAHIVKIWYNNCMQSSWGSNPTEPNHPQGRDEKPGGLGVGALSISSRAAR